MDVMAILEIPRHVLESARVTLEEASDEAGGSE